MNNQNSETMERQTTSSRDGWILAIVAYITIIGLIIAFILNYEKKHELASFHIRQNLGLWISEIVLTIIVRILHVVPVVGSIVSAAGHIFLFILWIAGLIYAIQARMKPVPVLGEHYQDWFKNLIR
jgi:uncharacterized membrane protein